MIDMFFRDRSPWHGGLARGSGRCAPGSSASSRLIRVDSSVSSWPRCCLKQASALSGTPRQGWGELGLGEAATELAHGLCEWCPRIELNRALQGAPCGTAPVLIEGRQGIWVEGP